MQRPPRPSLADTLLAATLLGLLFASYGILKPLRDNVGQCFGRWKLPDVWLGTAIVTGLTTAVLGQAASRWPRRKFAPWVFFGCAVVTGGAYLLFEAHGAGRVEVDDPVGFWLAAGFYWWVSSYLPIALALFWGLMADLYAETDARRLFGPIAFVGTVGQMLGAGFTGWFSAGLGMLPLLAIAVSLLVLATTLCVVLLRVRPRAGEPLTATTTVAAVGGRWWDGFVASVRSPFLGAILAYVGLQTLLSAVLSLEVVEVVRTHFGNDAAGQTARRAFNGRVDTWSQAATLGFQLLLVGPLLRRLGAGTALAIQPLAYVAGLAALTWCSGASSHGLLIAVAIIEVARRSSNYGFAKPGRDLLFTVCSRDERYKAKSVIDAAGFRAFDWAFGVLTNQWRALVGTLASTAVVAIPIALGWAWLAGTLGRMHRRRVERLGADEGTPTS